MASEEKSDNVTPENYRKALLEHFHSKLEKPNSEQLTIFAKELNAEKVDSNETVDCELFVKSLLPAAEKLSLFQLHSQTLLAEMRCKGLSDAQIRTHLSGLRFDYTPALLRGLANEIKKEVTSTYDRIAALPEKELNPNTTLLPLIQMAQSLSAIENGLEFMSYVSTDKATRDASTEVESDLKKYWVDIAMRKDVFQQLKKFNATVDHSKLAPEWKRFLEFELRDYKRLGLDLNGSDYDKMKELQKKMEVLQVDFQKNVNEEKSSYEFDESQLAGLEKDFIDARKQENGKIKVTLKYPDYFPIVRHCSVVETRKKISTAFQSRCIDPNAKIMEELVTLRDAKAKLLGKSCHSDHVLETRVAKNAATVRKFLEELSEKLTPLLNSDLDAFRKLKAKELESRGEKSDDVIHGWDYRYYMRMRTETEYGVDENKIKQYFPMQIVIKGALDIYQQLLSLRFEEFNWGKLWHDDVQCYSVFDKDTNKLFGYFFLDMYPREGKYGHACEFPLEKGCIVYDNDGKEIRRQLPIAAMLCNFPKPTADKPSLLPHDDVVTFFHEFGHVMHEICARADLPRFSGTNVEQDFVEAPSQMLENWCWFEPTLTKMSGHYDDHSKTLPKEMIDQLRKSKNANAGIFNKRQLFFGILDQTIHSTDKIDSAQICQDLQPKIMGIPSIDGTNFLASFGHLAGGYDSAYYGYMWSEVYCADMFYTKFGENGLFDTKAGLEYREKILKRGGSVDATEMLVDFLGREPNQTAFLKDKGLQV